MKYKDPFIKEPLFNISVNISQDSIKNKIKQLGKDRKLKVKFEDSDRIVFDCLFRIKGYIQFLLWSKALIIELKECEDYCLVETYGAIDVFRIWSFNKRKNVDINQIFVDMKRLFGEAVMSGRIGGRW